VFRRQFGEPQRQAFRAHRNSTLQAKVRYFSVPKVNTVRCMLFSVLWQLRMIWCGPDSVVLSLVVSGCGAWAEDSWRNIVVGTLPMTVCKPCERCKVNIRVGGRKYGNICPVSLHYNRFRPSTQALVKWEQSPPKVRAVIHSPFATKCVYLFMYSAEILSHR
jgi:hypothetical protein